MILYTGLAATTDALIRVSNSTLALVTSFASLQTTLVTITVQIANLLANCTTTVGDSTICGMIPPSDTIATDANYSAVSGLINVMCVAT